MTESGGKRGRKRTYDAESTREKILSAAGAVFSQHGFDGASVDAIAAEAGYNKSLIFQYFGDKQGLYAEVLRRADKEMEELLERLFAPLLEDETIASDDHKFRVFLKTAFESLLDHWVDHPHFMRMINWEQAEGWDTLAKISSRLEPTDLAQLEKLFSTAKQEGLIRHDLDVTIIILLVQQICWSAPTFFTLFPSFLTGRDFSTPVTLTHIREQIVDFLVAGFMQHQF